RIAAELAVDRALDRYGLEVHALSPVLPALHRPDRALRQSRLGARVLAEPGAQVPLDPGMDGRADGGGLLSLAIRRFDAGDRVGYGREHIFRVPSARSGEHFQHGGFEVSPLLFRIPRSKRRLGYDI